MIHLWMDPAPLILKRASASGPSGERNEDDYNVLAEGVVVGRIMRAIVAPVGLPWFWTLAYGYHHDRRPTHAGLAALPRAQEHSAHGQIHRNGARPVQEFLALTGGGKLGTTSASPSITLAFSPAARCAIRLSMDSRVRSSCSSVMALTPPECSNFISRGTRSAHIFM